VADAGALEADGARHRFPREARVQTIIIEERTSPDASTST
jgi:hypothetical protein